MLVTARLHKPTEDLAHEIVVGFFLKLQVFAVLDIPVELFGALTGKLLDRRLNLFFFDSIVLIVLVLAGKSLPW